MKTGIIEEEIVKQVKEKNIDIIIINTDNESNEENALENIGLTIAKKVPGHVKVIRHNTSVGMQDS